MATEKTAVTVQDSTRFRLEPLTLKQLKKMGSPGVTGVEPQIDSASGFLQRLAQKEEWRRNEYARAKEYIHSLVKGSSVLDNFVLVPANLILESAKLNYDSTVEEEKEAWNGVLEYIEERISKGTEYFIIDGQNRLNESIIPFFENKLPFDNRTLTFIEKDGTTKVHCPGKKFKHLSKDIQSYIEDIKVPLVVASSGDIAAFSKTLIWKNDGVAWDDWQKLIMDTWFTKFRMQIDSIASKDKGHAPSRNTLNLISGKKYAYDVNGHDRLVAEFLIWMKKGFIPKSMEDFKEWFSGKFTVTQADIDLLKRYLKDFSKKYPPKPQISNTVLRNYVMLRYVLDNPKKFRTDGINVPSWRIEKPVDFVSYYKVITADLSKNPENYGELSGYTPGPAGTRNKTPGSYAWSNSENGKGFLKSRMEILLRVLTGERKENIKCKKTFEELRDGGVIIEIDDTPMPSVEESWMNDHNDADGNIIPISQLDSGTFDRGHKIAKSKGGSNTDVVLQKKRDNRQWQEDYEHTQQ